MSDTGSINAIMMWKGCKNYNIQVFRKKENTPMMTEAMFQYLCFVLCCTDFCFHRPLKRQISNEDAGKKKGNVTFIFSNLFKELFEPYIIGEKKGSRDRIRECHCLAAQIK